MLMRIRVQFLAARTIWYVLSSWEYVATKRGTGRMNGHCTQYFIPVVFLSSLFFQDRVSCTVQP